MSQFKKLVQDVSRNINAHNLVLNGQSILLAVSGGSDSIALLKIFQTFRKSRNLKLSVAHVNYNMRPTASDAESIVANICQDAQMPLFIKHCDLTNEAKKMQRSIEDSARILRYDFFIECCLKNDIDCIATAHNLNDQTETILMQLLRGTGLKGLSGISNKRQEKNKPLIRPMLTISKERVLTSLSEQGVDYNEDETNLDPTYLRNRIRLKLLPTLTKDYNDSFDSHLCTLAADARETYEFLKFSAQRVLKDATIKKREGIALAMPVLRQYPPVVRKEVFLQALTVLTGKRAGFTRSDVDILDEFSQSNSAKAIVLKKRVQAAIKKNQLHITLSLKTR
ncbi:MAG: tRNA(Ile)-lysidine synthase [Candidatus Omnitrophota bacterium]|jgi:tRNA(Ile)-lysidine synthase